MFSKYRKIALTDAVQLTFENIVQFGGELGLKVNDDPRQIEIHTLEGVMIANVGDWLMRGAAGEFYPCKDAIFQETYEEA